MIDLVKNLFYYFVINSPTGHATPQQGAVELDNAVKTLVTLIESYRIKDLTIVAILQNKVSKVRKYILSTKVKDTYDLSSITEYNLRKSIYDYTKIPCTGYENIDRYLSQYLL